MFVTVKISYLDGKELDIEISDSELDRFAEHISAHKIYWDKDVIKGFWTDISNVRYINFLRHSDEDSHEQREPISKDC